MEGGGLVLFLVMISISMQMVVGVRGPPPAMYVFGDSILDVGNNNYLPGAGVSRANHPYYGIDYPFQIPTGRLSNGYNTADYAAMSMGFVAGSPPAYLSLLAHQGSLLAVTALSSGVSYASGGAGILNSTNAGNTIPLWKQVQYFRATRARMIATKGSGDAVLSRSVFLISVGSNDMFAFFAAQNSSSDQLQSDAAAALYSSLISNYSAAITGLYTIGARRFAIFSVALVGCVPAARLLSPTGACSDGLNHLAAGFNGALESLLAGLAAKQLPELAYSLANMYSLMQATFADPQASGYTDVASACCGGGRLNAEAACTPTSVLCTNRDQHFFWDLLHPSQRAAFLTVKAFYDGPAHYTTPINFMQLAHTSS